MTGPGWLGPVGHVGFIVDDFDAAMAGLAAAGTTWSSVLTPAVALQVADGRREEFTVRYVAAAGAEPRLKIISGVSGSYFAAVPGNAVHHLSYWVNDLATATARLIEAGFTDEATGLDADGAARYRYLVGPGGIRIELGLESNRAEFDAWANAA